MERVDDRRRAQDKVDLVFVHARPQAVYHHLVDDIALLDINAIKSGYSHTTIRAAGCQQQNGQQCYQSMFYVHKLLDYFGVIYNILP